MIIGITGTVGAGKSGVAAMMASALACSLVDTDEICRRLLIKGESAWLAVKEKLPQFFDTHDELNRIMLREAVFSDDQTRQVLEGVLHPLVRDEVLTLSEAARESGTDLLVEIPLLFEVGWEEDMDRVLSVYVPEKVSQDRVSNRDRVAVEQVQRILGLQLSSIEKAERADWVVDNSGNWSATFLQVSHLVCQLRAEVKAGKT